MKLLMVGISIEVIVEGIIVQGFQDGSFSLDANGKRSIEHQFAGNRVLLPARSSKTFSQCVLSPKTQPVNDEIDFAYYPADQSQPTTGHMQNACLGFIDSNGVHVLEYAHNCHLDAAGNLYLGKAS